MGLERCPTLAPVVSLMGVHSRVTPRELYIMQMGKHHHPIGPCTRTGSGDQESNWAFGLSPPRKSVSGEEETKERAHYAPSGLHPAQNPR